MNARLLAAFLGPRARVAGLVLLACGMAQAGPGAHGPNGEHLDATGASSAGTVAPRLEAQTDLFEMVARLGGSELSILIDRYATNEPVLKAIVEVESGGLKAKAKFHEDHGDYAVDDAALLKRLSTPGEHALVITVQAGTDADLLNGTLVVGATPAEAHGHGPGADHDHAFERSLWIGAGVLVAGGAAAAVLWRQRRRKASSIAGEFR
ncbi:hypothetical protein [Aquabacterium sp.]|uniref:hypothetical protein n=1 Tax=Aquabacterium sp. TaxID=1872578 RepID=UPI002C1AEE1C|nr:hypothetical protein [Aquabacterium sp.]HSW08033.1 hypothetical protein [Aquabacterium sp.]